MLPERDVPTDAVCIRPLLSLFALMEFGSTCGGGGLGPTEPRCGEEPLTLLFAVLLVAESW